MFVVIIILLRSLLTVITTVIVSKEKTSRGVCLSPLLRGRSDATDEAAVL